MAIKSYRGKPDKRPNTSNGYVNIAKKLIKENEGFSTKPYKDGGTWVSKRIPGAKTRRNPKTGNTEYWEQWYSVGYGFNDSGSRDIYPAGIASGRYKNGITEAEAEKELDRLLLKNIIPHLKKTYGQHWDRFNDNQKAAVIDTYYLNPSAVVGKNSLFLKAIKRSDSRAVDYLGVPGYDDRNKKRRNSFGGLRKSHTYIDPTDEDYQMFDFDLMYGLPMIQMPTYALQQAANNLDDQDLYQYAAMHMPQLVLQEIPLQDYLGNAIDYSALFSTPQSNQYAYQNNDYLPSTYYPIIEDYRLPQYEYGKDAIHIDPENRGKFTETMRHTGKTAEELSHSKNPLTRKRAIFALNARKWNH